MAVNMFTVLNLCVVGIVHINRVSLVKVTETYVCVIQGVLDVYNYINVCIA